MEDEKKFEMALHKDVPTELGRIVRVTWRKSGTYVQINDAKMVELGSACLNPVELDKLIEALTDARGVIRSGRLEGEPKVSK